MKMITKKIAVFVPNKPYFGATLVQIPFFHHLRLNFPETVIRVYSLVEDITMLRKLGLVDEVELYTKNKANLDTFHSLNTFHPDIAISMRPHSQNVNLIIGLSNSKLKVGYNNSLLNRMLFKKTIKINESIYRPLHYFDLLGILGLTNADFSFLREFAEQATLTFSDDYTYFCIMPGGGAGEFKRWGIENFINLCQKINQKIDNAYFLIVMGKNEKEYLDLLAKQMKRPNVMILLDETVENICKAVLKSLITIANDCGPSHLAQMCEVNYAAIYANYDNQVKSRLDEWFWKRDNAVAITTKDIIDIKKITVQEVFDAILKLIQ